MTSISATSSDPSCLRQGEGPPSLLHQSVEELTNWFSSEINFFLSTNNESAPAPAVVPTRAGTFTDPELVHPEGTTMSATAIISFSGRAVPITVILSLVPSLVPLHLRAGQGGELSSFTPSCLSQPSVNYSMAAGDITIDPRYSEYPPTPGGFPFAPQNSIPWPEVHCDHQPSGHGDAIQEPTPDCSPTAVNVPSGVRTYPPSFNQVPVAQSGHLVFSHPTSSLVRGGVFLPSPYQNEGNGLSTSRHVLGQTYQYIPTLSTGPMQGEGVDEHPSRYGHQPSRHSDTTQEPMDCHPTAVTASPRVRLYPGYVVSDHPSLLPSPVNGCVVLPAHHNEGNGLSTIQQLVQTHQDSPTLSATAGPIRGVADRHPSRHQCTMCRAGYAWPSGLNRHFKDEHLPRIACDFCDLKFSSGRRYLLTQHLETHRSNA